MGVLGNLWGAHFVALEAQEGSKKHIRGSNSTLLRILCERKDALAAPSGRDPKSTETARSRHLTKKTWKLQKRYTSHTENMFLKGRRDKKSIKKRPRNISKRITIEDPCPVLTKKWKRRLVRKTFQQGPTTLASTERAGRPGGDTGGVYICVFKHTKHI